MQRTLFLPLLYSSEQMDMACFSSEETSEVPVENKRNKQKNWRSRISYFLQKPSSKEAHSSRSKAYRPTVEEVNQWSQSLEKLLSHKYGQAAFRIFLKSEFCEENIEFWLACEDFRKIKSPAKRASRANTIYNKFIKSEAPKEINLDFHTKDTIIQNLQVPTTSCFNAAQKRVYNLMENNSYPRFLQSEIYKELWAISQGKGKYLKS